MGRDRRQEIADRLRELRWKRLIILPMVVTRRGREAFERDWETEEHTLNFELRQIAERETYERLMQQQQEIGKE